MILTDLQLQHFQAQIMCTLLRGEKQRICKVWVANQKVLSSLTTVFNWHNSCTIFFLIMVPLSRQLIWKEWNKWVYCRVTGIEKWLSMTLSCCFNDRVSQGKGPIINDSNDWLPGTFLETSEQINQSYNETFTENILHYINLEERMILYVLGSLCSESHFWIFLQKLQK